MYTCNDSCADGLLENDFCHEINSLSLDSSDPPSFVTHTLNPTIELKPLPDSFKYIFQGHNETFPAIITSNLNEDQESKLLKILKEKNKETIGRTLGDIKDISP